MTELEFKELERMVFDAFTRDRVPAYVRSLIEKVEKERDEAHAELKAFGDALEARIAECERYRAALEVISWGNDTDAQSLINQAATALGGKT